MHVSDAIRKVTAQVQQALDDGHRSRVIDADDVVDILLAIADQLDPPVPVIPADANELLAATQALLQAREDQMVTSTEWDRLRRAVQAAAR